MSIVIGNGITIGPGIVIGNSGIVTGGLQLALDAQNYSGSGTTWAAATGSNATLFNTPTYTAASPTYFNFAPASFEYASTPALPSASSWTIEAWFRITASLTGQVTSVITDEFNLSNLNFSMGTNNAPLNYNISIGFFDGAWRATTGFAPTQNVWVYCAGTYNGSAVVQYVNGGLHSSVSYTGTSSSGGLSTRIARRWDSSDSVSDNFFPGDIAVVRVYNIALTGTQILQNFNAEKSRFGL